MSHHGVGAFCCLQTMCPDHSPLPNPEDWPTGSEGLRLDLAPGQADGWEGLARKLAAPAKSVDPDGLAEEFGLSPGIVTEVLKGLEHRPAKELPWVSLGRLISSALKEVFDQLRGVFRKWTDHPRAFLYVTLLLFLAVAYASLWFGRFFAQSHSENLRLNFNGPIGLTMLILVMSVGLAFYRWGSYRPLGLTAGLLLLGFQPLLIFVASTMGRSDPAIQWALLTLASLAAIAFLIGLFALFALAGSWVQLQKDDRREERLSRQEMLDRLFSLESRLRLMPTEAFRAKRISLKEKTRQSAFFPYYAVFFGMAFGLIEVLAVTGLSRILQQGDQGIEATRGAIRSLFGLVSLVLSGFLGYYTGGVWRSLVAAVVALGGSLLALLVPIAPFGIEAFRSTAGSQAFALWAAGSIALAVFGGAAGIIDSRTLRRRKARANDPSALIAEVILLRRRLQADQQMIVVMAVDVARSTSLKQDQDPLDVEFTFREYQKLVQAVVQEEGGEVFSTAGDGALASFRDGADALRASRLLQAHIQTFNQITNRLGGDFRLRIGLHAGETQAGFSDVPYHELIDIAAHVESAAPVGGIAMTDAARELLPDEEMAEVAAQVDGHSVWIVLKPVLYP